MVDGVAIVCVLEREIVFFLLFSFRFIFHFLFFSSSVFQLAIERSKSTGATAAAAGQQRENTSRRNIIIHDGHQPEKPVHKTCNGDEHTRNNNTQHHHRRHRRQQQQQPKWRRRQQKRNGKKAAAVVAATQKMKKKEEKKNHQRQHRAKWTLLTIFASLRWSHMCVCVCVCRAERILIFSSYIKWAMGILLCVHGCIDRKIDRRMCGQQFHNAHIMDRGREKGNNIIKLARVSQNPFA